MNIRIDPRTLRRAEERGASEVEIRETIETGETLDAKHGRLRKWRIFRFQLQRHGKFYEHKRVEVIYTPEGNSLVTITVYVFYGRWEEWT